MTDRWPLLRELVAGHFLPGRSGHIGIAVSGGGDSMALMHLLAEVARDSDMRLRAVTVDHGLRAEAADESRLVARAAAGLRIPHDTLEWRGWDGTGNLQAAAREARYRLICDWAKRNCLSEVALGHTADDQAETVLLRLARSAGPDGLSGMPVRRRQDGITLVRPMLDLRRADLRAYLTALGVDWAEDPSNDDESYDRVRARNMLEVLKPLGVDTRALCRVAKNAQSVRGAIDWYAFREAHDVAEIDRGDVILSERGFRLLQPEIRRRLLAQSLCWVSGAAHGPRHQAMALLMDAIQNGVSMTLSGCQIRIGSGTIRLFREAAAVRDVVCPTSEIWDGRWRLSGPWPGGAEIRALGEAGLAECPDWRETGLPRQSLLASPAVWRGDLLVAAPHAGRPEGWAAELVRDADQFFAAFLSH